MCKGLGFLQLNDCGLNTSADNRAFRLFLKFFFTYLNFGLKSLDQTRSDIVCQHMKMAALYFVTWAPGWIDTWWITHRASNLNNRKSKEKEMDQLLSGRPLSKKVVWTLLALFSQSKRLWKMRSSWAEMLFHSSWLDWLLAFIKHCLPWVILLCWASAYN